MTPNERRLRLDLAAARYLDAAERDDFDTVAELWADAATDAELAAALREVHTGLVEGQKWRADTGAIAAGDCRRRAALAECDHHPSTDRARYRRRCGRRFIPPPAGAPAGRGRMS